MKVIKVASPVFSTKQRFLSAESYINMQKLLSKMNNQTEFRITSQRAFESDILGRIDIKDKYYFHDGRILMNKTHNREALKRGSSTFATHNTEMRINNANGEVEFIKKPWYKSAKRVIKQAEKYIQLGLNEFDNSAIVKKHFARLEGFTPEWYKKFCEKGNI